MDTRSIRSQERLNEKLSRLALEWWGEHYGPAPGAPTAWTARPNLNLWSLQRKVLKSKTG